MKRVTIATLVLLLCWGCDGVTKKQPGKQSTDRSGAELYASYCKDCHGIDGAGVDGEAVLIGRQVWSEEPDTLLRTLLFGWAGSGQGHGNVLRAMPPVPYTNAEIARVAEYVMSAVGKRTVEISEERVQRIQKQHQAAVQQKLHDPTAVR